LTLIATTNVFCRRCGRALWSEQGKSKGIGSSCEKKENQERKIKPYIQEVPYILSGSQTQQSLILDFINSSKEK
jgi:hypothetical protein